MDTQPSIEPKAIPAPPVEFEAQLEAILLSTDKPIPLGRIVEAFGQLGHPIDDETIATASEKLNAAYERTGRAFRIERVAGGIRLMVKPEFADVLAAFHGQRQSARLSRAAIETLSIIAYRQPVTRAKLEAIRGVACGEVLKTLLERNLIAITGRAEELGRPMLYGTSKRFLDVFGLASIKDLPAVEGVLPMESVPPAQARSDDAAEDLIRDSGRGSREDSGQDSPEEPAQ